MKGSAVPPSVEEIHNAANSPGWRDKAGCQGSDTRLFYPEQQMMVPLKVKQICYSCPVRSACLYEAISRNDKHGMWGGVTPKGRRSIRRNYLKAFPLDKAKFMQMQEA